MIGYTGDPRLTRNAPPNVRFSGYVEEHEKAALIAEAHGLIMPSLAEGFGVPIIEALAANTPVLCSDIAVFREVAGELADYFDPFSIEEICASVTRVLAQAGSNGATASASAGPISPSVSATTPRRAICCPTGSSAEGAAPPRRHWSVPVAAFNGATAHGM